jgi:ribonucleoside-diphosphate reductase alpha chain
MEGIFESIKNAALIHKSGGGTGFSFSRLRPKGASVNTTGGVASGPVSFMKVFNAATEAVKQGGTRRGANMGILRVDHPDILDFITSKRDNADITNFNISVAVTEEFMKAVEQGRDYDLIDPYSNVPVAKQNARAVFDLMVEMSWTNGEPGIIFIDRLNKDNVTPEIGKIESTNPCGEQPLLPYEACNLGSINLSLMIKNSGTKAEVDLERLGRTVRKAVHFLDNVIDVNKYPLPEIDEMTRSTRKIGLGVMGWADLLCKLNIPYNSQKACTLAERVMFFIQEESKKASMELAEKKGVFPCYDKSIYREKGMRLRNATTTTIAPTGTLSIIAGVSSGIEPLFAISYIRNVMDNDELLEVNPLFKQIAIIDGFYSENLMRRIAKKGSIKGFPEIPKTVQNVFATSHDISAEWHIKMQAIFQKYTDNAVSKTVNLKHNATKDDVREVFEMAYRTGCKGVTLYRDGSRDAQVLNIGSVNKGKTDGDDNTDNAVAANTSHIAPRPRPEIATGFTEKVRIGCGNLYITVNYDEHGICEVFTNTGRAGGCPSQSEATARLVSIALRSGIDAKSIVEQLKGIRCPSTIKQTGIRVLSCPDAIGRLIEKVVKIQNGKDVSDNELAAPPEDVIPRPMAKVEAVCHACAGDESDGMWADAGKTSAVCPECGLTVEHEGGCMVCRNCGFSKCG